MHDYSSLLALPLRGTGVVVARLALGGEVVRGQRGKLQAELTTSWQAMALALSASPAFLAGYQQIAHACDAGSRLQCSRIGKPPMRTPTMVATLEEKWSKQARDTSRYASFAFTPEGLDTSSDVGFSYEDLAASVGEIKKYSRGDTVTGSVVSFEPNGAVVDIGVKSSAYCGLSEMALVKPGTHTRPMLRHGPRHPGAEATSLIWVVFVACAHRQARAGHERRRHVRVRDHVARGRERPAVPVAPPDPLPGGVG